MSAYKYVVGIDLGTTNTLACWLHRGKMELVRFPGGTMLPSILYVDNSGKQYIGKMAKQRGSVDPANMIRSSKTKMGKPRQEASWVCNGRTYTPTDVATEILKEVRRNFIKQAKIEENAEIGAVITVPAYFNSNQKEETRKAGEAAGFKVMRIITEPMAAAIAAITDMELLDRKVLVVDLGGGTFDLCVLEADKDAHAYETIEVDGDPGLGGDDFDSLMLKWLLRLIGEDTGRDFSSFNAAGMAEGEYNGFLARLRDSAEILKIDLSDSQEARLEMPELLSGYDLSINFSRDEFNELCRPLFDRIFEITNNFLLQNPEKFTREDIGEIILAGGSCYIPYIQEEIERIFSKTPRGELDKSKLVVQGAAHVAEWLNSGMESRTTEILSHSLGVAVYSESGRDIFSKLLHKSTPYPVSRKEVFTTAADNQENIVVKIYEAGTHCEESEDLADHDFYGSMVLEGIEVAPQGVPQIEVTFSYDHSSCLTVSARDLRTGASQSLNLRKGEHVEDPVTSTAPMDIMLLMDVSGSMEGRELAEAKEASHRLVNELIDFSSHRMGLVAFNHDARLGSPLTADRDGLNRSIDGLRASGGTNMFTALEKARGAMRDSDRKKIVILTTDGGDFEEERTLKVADAMRKKGFRIVAIGAGTGINQEFLVRLADEGDFYTLRNMGELASTFEKIINGLARRR